MGSATTNVGLFIRSLMTDPSTGATVPGGRSAYVSPSWRSSAGRAITVDGIIYDWLGTNFLNDADDMMPGAVAVNASTGAHMRVTWDSNFMYIALIGPTFGLTDGMLYLDTGAGGSSSGDNWHVTHTLPFEADYMLWIEDLNNWGIRKVMPTGNWVDTTSSCTGMNAVVFMGNPYLTTPVSEWRIPFDCMGSPALDVRWLAIVQWDGVPGFGTAGQVSGVFPEQPFDNATTSGQFFGKFGTFNLQGGDLADGTLDDHLLIFRTYTGSSTPGAPHIYQIMVKVRNAEGDYWDWGDNAPLIMTTNQEVDINILRAKPVIENLVDVEYDEDTGTHTITLIDKASDFQDSSASLSWFVTDHPGNTHTYPTPYTYGLSGGAGTAGGVSGASLGVDTLENQFGGHRLILTVIDSHGMTAMQTLNIGIWNVNDAPVICNQARFDCMPVFSDDGDGNQNVYDENFGGMITKELGDTSNASRSYIVDMQNEQQQSDWNSESIPQTYTWTADEGNCVPFTTSIVANVISLAENTANEAGGNCDITLDLTDGASEYDGAASMVVNFIVNPVNDAPVIKNFDATTGAYVETANGSLQLDWFWDVMEDDEDSNNLTFNLSRLMADNDHPVDQLIWSIEETQLCTYGNYFSLTVDNDADTLTMVLIPDAATDAPTSEIDFLQDADGDGSPDDGVHQMQPASGVYCTIYLWLEDTEDAPSHIDYAQSASGVYDQRSVRETIYIRVINTVEARPDYHFDEERGFNWLNIEAVLPGTRVPVDITITNSGDDPAQYNYGHDVQVRFYVDDNPTLLQDQITLSWEDGEVPGIGETVTIRGYVTLNNPSQYVRSFIEVRTINPFTGYYIDSSIRRPLLEEMNWDNNNLTTDDTGDGLPSMVRLRPATSVASFAPGVVAVGLVGAFVGALMMRSRKDEDEEEFASLSTDDEAVSPVIATILLVAITVVLSGVLYVWANSLATDTTGKSTPRLTFESDARFEHTGDQSLWYWRITVNSHDTELAAQAVFVVVQWTDSAGVAHSHRISLAETDGVYGRVPSNSPELVTYRDSINCAQDCSAGFGANDVIQVRMTNDSTIIENAIITLQYSPQSGTSVILMTFAASFNPPNIKATY
jgi:flagellin-like protein